MLRISVVHGPLDAAFEGRISEDGTSFDGGWRPNPGADETVDVAYDVEGTRVAHYEAAEPVVTPTASPKSAVGMLPPDDIEHR